MSEIKDQVQAETKQDVTPVTSTPEPTPQPEVKAEVVLEAGVRPDNLSAVVILDGKPVVIKKLKARAFYQAQKAFASVYGSLASMMSEDAVNKIAERKKKEGKDPSQLTSEDFTEDELAQVSEASSSKSLQNIISDAPQELAKFVAICCDMKDDELIDMAYPDEISEAFPICYELNNVLENIKKFGAPMQAISK